MIIFGIKWKCEGLFQATAIETIYDGTRCFASRRPQLGLRYLQLRKLKSFYDEMRISGMCMFS